MFRSHVFSQLIPALGIAVCVGCCLLALFARRAARAAADSKSLVRKLEARLTVAEKNLEFIMQMAPDHSRRLALLESRARTAKPQAALADVAERTSNGMNEKRHRVLAMARRGIDTETIAERLAMPNGEVELILSLNAAA